MKAQMKYRVLGKTGLRVSEVLPRILYRILLATSAVDDTGLVIATA